MKRSAEIICGEGLQGGHFFLDMAKRPLAGMSTQYLVPRKCNEEISRNYL